MTTEKHGHLHTRLLHSLVSSTSCCMRAQGAHAHMHAAQRHCSQRERGSCCVPSIRGSRAVSVPAPGREVI